MAFLLDGKDDKLASRAALVNALAVFDADPTTEPPAGVAMARYIAARQLVQLGLLPSAIAQMSHVVDDEERLPPPFREQALLALGTACARAGDAARARDLFVRAADRAERPAMRLLLRDRAERAATAMAAPNKPKVVTATSDPAWADRLLLGANEAGAF